jgi:hypothetical protein
MAKKKEVAPVEEPKEPKLCGHINVHAGLDGKGKPVVCSLEKGHKGNHRGTFTKKIVLRKYSQTQPPRLVSKSVDYKVVETDWQDAAGHIPPSYPDEILPLSMAEQEFGPEIGKQIVGALNGSKA